MIKFLNALTLNDIGRLKKTFFYEIGQSILRGQAYVVILMVVLELLKPLLEEGRQVATARLFFYFLWMLFATVLLFFVTKHGSVAETVTAYGIGTDGRIRLGDYVRKLSMGFFKGRDPGDITALMLQDYANIETMLGHLLMSAFGSIIMPLVFLAFLIPLNVRMALITLAPLPLSIIVAAASRSLVMNTGKRHIASKNNATSRMLEYLEGIKNIKAFNLTGEKFSRLKKAFLALKRDSILVEATGGPAVILGVWILNMGIALIMLSGISFILKGTLSIPHFLFFLIVGTRMYDPLSRAMVNFVEISYYSLSVRRIQEIYDIKPLPEPREYVPVTGHDIEFKNVTFRYHNTDVLKDVSFTLRHDNMTALVGPSGSGKSTITRLIARFWDVNSGSLHIGGRDIKDITYETLIGNISMVFQDVYLFQDTVLNNIKVGKPEAGRDEIFEAAKKARCHDFIMELDKGYDTLVGEGGATLSGGEKQRISLARAMLKNAPIVLLDEATASLDPENELYIQQAIDELIKGRTLVVIAHRLSTITHADKILVLDRGRIVEQGTHEELLQNSNGMYRTMWTEQEKAHTWRIAG
ncbi:MAG: ABC transporter ATP-binding protein [Spirochaetales bacterium]|nr:ABC transporter ATP-binding protein [Spirochaetales bacterium]